MPGSSFILLLSTCDVHSSVLSAEYTTMNKAKKNAFIQVERERYHGTRQLQPRGSGLYWGRPRGWADGSSEELLIPVLAMRVEDRKAQDLQRGRRPE
jgi:hypothetical protein